jgi:biopolymer transport protein ExbD
MKLQTTLPQRPGFLHVLPLFDLFGLLLVFLLLGPSFLMQAGVSVELPASQFQMERYGQPVVVTLAAGPPAGMYFERQPVSMEELGELLERRRGEGLAGEATMLLRSDRGVAVGVEQAVMELALGKNFRVVKVGSPVLQGSTLEAGGGASE